MYGFQIYWSSVMVADAGAMRLDWQNVYTLIRYAEKIWSYSQILDMKI